MTPALSRRAALVDLPGPARWWRADRMIRTCTPATDLTICPTALRRTLAYLGTGSLPPLPMPPPLTLPAAVAVLGTSTLCLAAGYLLGSAITL